MRSGNGRPGSPTCLHCSLPPAGRPVGPLRRVSAPSLRVPRAPRGRRAYLQAPRPGDPRRPRRPALTVPSRRPARAPSLPGVHSTAAATAASRATAAAELPGPRTRQSATRRRRRHVRGSGLRGGGGACGRGRRAGPETGGARGKLPAGLGRPRGAPTLPRPCSTEAGPGGLKGLSQGVIIQQ